MSKSIDSTRNKPNKNKSSSMKSLLSSFHHHINSAKHTSSSVTSSQIDSKIQQQQQQQQYNSSSSISNVATPRPSLPITPQKENPLIFYLTNAKWTKVEHRLKRIPGEASYTYPVTIKSSHNQTSTTLRLLPLHYACALQNTPYAIIKALIHADIDVCKCNDITNRLPLHYACETANNISSIEIKSIELLVESYPMGMKQKEDVFGFLPLHLACCAPQQIHKRKDKIIFKVKLLLQYYKNATKIKSTRDKWLPLHVACKTGASLEIIQLLLEAYPAAVYEKDINNRLPIHLAVGCIFKSVDVVKLLTSYYVKGLWEIEEKYGFLPLHIACSNISASSFSISITNSKKSSSFAAVELIHTLVSLNPSAIYVPSSLNQSLPLHIACRVSLGTDSSNSRTLSYDIIHALLSVDSNKGSVRCYDIDQRLPLHWACHSGTGLCPRGVQLLLDAYHAGAQAVEAKYGYLPLHVACSSSSSPQKISTSTSNTATIIHSLLSTYPEANYCPDANGNLPIHLLCQNQFIHADILQTLLSFHSDLVHIHNTQGLTPKMVVAQNYLFPNKDAILDILDNVNNEINATSIPQFKNPKSIHDKSSLFLPIHNLYNLNQMIKEDDEEDYDSPRDVTQLFPTSTVCNKKNPPSRLNHDNLSKCMYCMEQPATNIVYPCGHPCFCNDCKELYYDCASGGMNHREESLSYCPICRCKIKDVVKVYGNVLGCS